MWSNRVGQSRETDDIDDEDCVEEEFQLARVKCDRDDERGREALGEGNCSSIFEMDHNWNYVDPRKAVHILKTIFQYFYYLVFRMISFV